MQVKRKAEERKKERKKRKNEWMSETTGISKGEKQEGVNERRKKEIKNVRRIRRTEWDNLMLK